MSDVLAVRDSDLVMRELAQATASVIEAQRVIIVGAGSIPKLLGELNSGLRGLGYVCVPLEPAQGLYKTFADLLACPSLAPLLQEPCLDPAGIVHQSESPPKPENERAKANALSAIPFSSYVPGLHDQEQAAPEPSTVDVSTLDMSKPINWKAGDVFISNPRITLPHQRRKWLLDFLDLSDLDNLTGVDVQIRSPNTTTTELMTLKQFMAQYVFLERPAAEQSATE